MATDGKGWFFKACLAKDSRLREPAKVSVYGIKVECELPLKRSIALLR
jgi:hypothetical protein